MDDERENYLKPAAVVGVCLLLRNYAAKAAAVA